jgi:3'-phosphoadenosine 5'-phosphosulfate sulfotransferase (PAPS reductase)/FAD synthetase
MINLTSGYCRLHGPTRFGKQPRHHSIGCMTCGLPPSSEDEAIHIGRCRTKNSKKTEEASGTGMGEREAIAPSALPEQLELVEQGEE